MVIILRSLPMQSHILQNAILDELDKLSTEIAKLVLKKVMLDNKIDGVKEKSKHLVNTYISLTGKEPSLANGKLTLLFQTAMGKNTIGNSLELILRERGSLEMSEAIESLRKQGIRLSQQYPRNVVSNLVKHDQRFTRLKDDRITLNEK
jgi:hypothetical protein